MRKLHVNQRRAKTLTCIAYTRVHTIYKLQSKEHCNKTFISPCNRYIGMSLTAHCNVSSISNPKVEIGR